MKPQISVRAETVEQVEEALRAGAGEIVFGGESYHHRAIPLSDYEKAVELAHNAQADVYKRQVMTMESSLSGTWKGRFHFPRSMRNGTPRFRRL